MAVRAVFLDRDGTVIVDPPDLRVDSIEDIKLFPETQEAMRKLSALDYVIVLISNQAGIAEGRFNVHEYYKINNEVIKILELSGVKINGSYFCPHSPEDNCECRKPKPAMLLRAAEELDIDLASSWMIGDRESDIIAGLKAGTKTILVQTGNSPVISSEATYTAPTILEAVDYIAKH